eukprot:5186138-Pleurochrysis_carterae.AAC.1
MGPLAPAARGPFIAPFLIGFWARPLRIGCLRSFFFATHGESVRRVRVELKLATNVARFRITENAARCADGEGQISYAGIEGQLDVQQCGQA